MTYSLEAYRGKTVLVTGATGFTGQVLAKKLVAAGANVRAIARKSSVLGDLEPLDIQWYRGDVFDPGIIDQAVDGVHYIFHLAAAFREVKSSTEGYRLVHVTSTELLAKAVIGKQEFECFVHVSTVGVHGHIEVDRADEDYRFAPGDDYQNTKLEGELWLRDFAKENNIPFSVVRPAPIMGPGDMRLLKMFRMVNKGFFLMLGGGKGMYHLVHVDDLTNVMLLSGITPEARSEVFIAAGDEPLGMVEIAKIIAEKIGKKVRIIRLPITPFYAAAYLCERILPPLGIQPPIYRRRVDFYTKDRQFDNSKSRKLLNYEFKYTNELGIEETANWYKKNGLLD
ncbi:MAG: NAD-dependent epimerase/dehydratase family protein [Gammaproteobacteria bacterium]|nr:NAD-dependent epimerase/dehydratase family protein [Gammaproteobacteria bacterium]